MGVFEFFVGFFLRPTSHTYVIICVTRGGERYRRGAEVLSSSNRVSTRLLECYQIRNPADPDQQMLAFHHLGIRLINASSPRFHRPTPPGCPARVLVVQLVFCMPAVNIRTASAGSVDRFARFEVLNRQATVGLPEVDWKVELSPTDAKVRCYTSNVPMRHAFCTRHPAPSGTICHHLSPSGTIWHHLAGVAKAGSASCRSIRSFDRGIHKC